jgi:hypothetical protein
VWRALHYIALGYPRSPSAQDKANYRRFYTSLSDVLPCRSCANNYSRHLEEVKIDPHLDSPLSLFDWTVDMHNVVNKSLGKPVMGRSVAYANYTQLPPPPSPAAAVGCAQQRMRRKLTITLCFATVIVVCLAAWTVLCMWRRRPISQQSNGPSVTSSSGVRRTTLDRPTTR